MSNTTPEIEIECDVLTSCPSIELLLQPKDKDLGGFSVRRLIPTKERRQIGPWVFFDHMGPATFRPGDGVNVRPHPHIGLATVTYLFEGEILHRDSLGTEQAIYPEDINLMAAGRGIVHSERERDEVRNTDHNAHGLQLWLALPRDKEEMSPEFFHYDRAEIPAVEQDDIKIRVLIGSAFGVTSPVVTFSDTLYFEASLNAGDSLAVPQIQERAIYVVEGELKIEETIVPEHCMAVLSPKDNITLQATTKSKIALIGGEKFDKRFMDWNFVSTDKKRIEQAKQDWKAGKFPKVPGDEEEFIPLPG